MTGQMVTPPSFAALLPSQLPDALVQVLVLRAGAEGGIPAQAERQPGCQLRRQLDEADHRAGQEVNARFRESSEKTYNLLEYSQRTALDLDHS